MSQFQELSKEFSEQLSEIDAAIPALAGTPSEEPLWARRRLVQAGIRACWRKEQTLAEDIRDKLRKL